MDRDYWGLDRAPFRAAFDTSRFYPSSEHEEAIARLEYLVETHRRVGVLLGEPGVGKSLTLRVVRERLLRRGASVVAVDAIGLGTREFLWQTAAGLGTAPREDADLVRLWRLVADRVVENRWQQIDTVLLVDDAGQAGPDLLAQLARLARLDPVPSARWTLLLAADPHHAARWNESIRELVDLRFDLRPWSEEDTVGFVQTALVDAGRFDPVFDDEALAALHELTGGVPRRVARLAELAMLAGAAARHSSVDAEMVRAAFEELRWPVAEAMR